jgi:hypothetical protein
MIPSRATDRRDRAFRSAVIVEREGARLEAVHLVSSCLIAMVAVFVLLAALALTIELITRFFPERARAVDPSVAAAISTAVAAAFPGAVVTRIEE